MNNWLLLSILAVASYFYGSINWAMIISKFKRVDIRKMGSGNPGTLNMSRNLGLKAGLLTFFLDVMKGVVPTLISFLLTKDRRFEGTEFIVADFAVFLSGFCVVIGHIYPIFMKFKGGKGVATTIGVFLVASFVFGWEWGMIAIMALVGAGVFIYFTEFGAMGSFIAITPPAIGASIRLFLTYNYIETVGFTYYFIANVLIFAICLFTWFAHRRNIERMLAGDEHPTSIKEMVIKMRLKKQEVRDNKQENK